MRQNFEIALKLVLQHEGGYVNNPHDPGGATNFGITQHTYDAWNQLHGNMPTSVKHITHEQVAAIYQHDYWDAIDGDDLPSGIDIAVFDFAVNSGPRRAISMLQRALEVPETGHLALPGKSALKVKNHHEVLSDLQRIRLGFLMHLANWKYFGKGWGARCHMVEAEARVMIA